MKRIVALAIFAAALGAYLKRPVKQPASTGEWDPAEPERTRH